ncbi:MAG TPA: hypothetical protein VGV17_15945 [Bosea sp. (in: a-proteobacteria)]|jgi:hypothetical protein|uniref:hypothetical protein n=1 Tax=Bosea sp. (in: a-proteobacteria) TaxID=1871050 RepID=UPI002DDD2078|nr:hypothetical protein [Bosea sp. (in: a-proteobacteria)]HEV2555247.1 hypothetical protein [Bosea sp. (in: a-proteobacteria)]
MASFIAVDHDPFAPQSAAPQAGPMPGAPQASPQAAPRFVAVDHDPFASPANSPRGESAPSGFATRAEREGGDMQEAEYLADAVRMRLQQDKASPMGRLDAYARGVASWVPGMDKLAAAGDAAFGAGQGETFGDRYGDNLKRQRAIDTADAALNPGSRFAGQGAGLVGTAAVLPAVTAVREGVRGAATANAALTGGLYGAVTGAVESDGGLQDKATAAAQTGALGLAAGAAAPTVISAAGKVASGVGNLASAVARPFRSAVTPEAEATRRVADAFARDGVTDPAAALRTMQAHGAPAVVGDVGGETTRALARSAANLSPEGRGILTEATADRFAGQGDRFTDLLRSLGPSSAGKTLDELQAAARAANRPAYGRAYMQGGRGIWTPDLEGLAQAPAVQDAIRSVIRTGANKTVAEGMPPLRNPFTTDAAGNLTLARQTDGSIARPNLQFWDYVQRELRGKAGEAARAGNKDLAGDFNSLRRAIVDRLDEAVPAFREARSGAARAFQAEDALEAGQKFVTARMANEEARKALARMTPAERELFAEGFRTDLIAKIRETGDGRDVVKAIFGSPAARERVSIALGARQAASLEAAIATETAMLRLQTAIGGNSSTARQIAEMALAGAPATALGSVTGYYQGGGPGAVAGAVAANALRRGRLKLDGGLAKKIAEMLASDDPAQLKRVAQMAVKSRPVMNLLDAIADEAGQFAGLTSGRPFEQAIGSRSGSAYVPAAAGENEQ